MSAPQGSRAAPCPGGCPNPWVARISHHLTAEARDRPAITSLRLLAVLNVGFNYASARGSASLVARVRVSRKRSLERQCEAKCHLVCLSPRRGRRKMPSRRGFYSLPSPLPGLVRVLVPAQGSARQLPPALPSYSASRDRLSYLTSMGARIPPRRSAGNGCGGKSRRSTHQ